MLSKSGHSRCTATAIYLLSYLTSFAMATSTLRIITSNVRFDGLSSQPVPIPSNGTIQTLRRHWTLEDPYKERPWAERRSRLTDALMFWGPDVIGFQEVLHNQLHDIQVLLGSAWAHVGVGRDDGNERGEYSPIFYDSERFEMISWGTKWLSKHPNEPGSKDWDASQTRIATFLTLRDKRAHRSGRQRGNRDLIHLVNTHYDDQGKKSRGKASLLIREFMHGWVEMNERRGDGEEEGLVVWMGDFNAPTDDPKEKGYTHAVSPDPLPHSRGDDMFFLDIRTSLDRRRASAEIAGKWRMNAPYGHKGTYTGFKQPGCEVDDPIDLILVASARSGGGPRRKTAYKPWSDRIDQEALEADEPEQVRGGWEVERYGVIDNVIAGRGDESGWVGRWSDHRAVGVELRKFD